jgi:hypothetical protein
LFQIRGLWIVRAYARTFASTSVTLVAIGCVASNCAFGLAIFILALHTTGASSFVIYDVRRIAEIIFADLLAHRVFPLLRESLGTLDFVRLFHKLGFKWQTVIGIGVVAVIIVAASNSVLILGHQAL